MDKPNALSSRCLKLFKTMVYHTDRARRFALTSPLLLPERVPVVISIRLFDPPFKRRVFLWAAEKRFQAIGAGHAAFTARRQFRPSPRESASFRSVRALRRSRRVSAPKTVARSVRPDSPRASIFSETISGARAAHCIAFLSRQFVAFGEQRVDRLTGRRKPLDHAPIEFGQRPARIHHQDHAAQLRARSAGTWTAIASQ